MIASYKIRFASTAGLFFFGACILVLGWFAQSKSFQTFQIRGIEYLGVPDTSKGSGLRITGPVSVKKITHLFELNSLNISFEFMTQEPTFSYGNLFQTGDTLDAIRMELQPSSNLVLVLSNGKLFPLSNFIQIGKYHGVRLKYARNQFFKVFVDETEVLNITDKGVLAGEFDISNIVVGTGLARQRTLVGSVKNFNLNGAYSYYDRAASLSRWMLILLCGIVFLKSLHYGSIAAQFSHLYSEFRIYLKLRNCELSRDIKLKYLITTITVGFVAITIFYYYRGMVLEMEFPKNTFLPAPVNRFGDFYSVIDQWSRMAFNGVGYGLSYFPSTYLIVNMFSHIQPIMFSLITFLTIFFCFFLIYAYLNLRSRHSFVQTIQNVVVCAFMTYPVLFTIHTANFEIFVFMLLCLFVYLYQHGKFALSSLPLAMIISMKVFPAVFLILFVADKKYKEIFLSLIVVVTLSLLPLFIFDGGMSSGFDVYFGNLKASQKMYADLMIMGPAGNHFGHSLLNGLRIVAGDDFLPMQKILLPYLALSIFTFLMISLFIIFVERVFWKRIALLVVSMCLLPYTSTDYKLLHFFIPLFIFINHGKTELEESESFDLYYTLLFSLLLIPKNYYYFHDNPLYTLNNVLNPILMIALLLLIVRSRMQQIMAMLRFPKKMAFG